MTKMTKIGKRAEKKFLSLVRERAPGLRTLIPVKRVFPGATHHTKDAAGADYWVAKTPVEVKGTVRDRFELGRLSVRQRDDLSGKNGFICIVFFNKTERTARYSGAALLPYSVALAEARKNKRGGRHIKAEDLLQSVWNVENDLPWQVLAASVGIEVSGALGNKAHERDWENRYFDLLLKAGYEAKFVIQGGAADER